MGNANDTLGIRGTDAQSDPGNVEEATEVDCTGKNSYLVRTL